jgi:phosphopantothenoylcysteine decarboxylase/phosphopantothenate--cysteine ligase
MAEVPDIIAALARVLGKGDRTGSLARRRAIVTSGPTHEAIDPVRYIANRSSGKQGHAVAAALAGLGADVTLVSGPTNEPTPDGVQLVRVESANDMLKAVRAALPADIAVCAAAVADWSVANPAPSKIKRGVKPPTVRFASNPDILATISQLNRGRPKLVVGFAAETANLLKNAKAKLAAKGCDWIVANDVTSGVFGGDNNTVHLITNDGVEDWPTMRKQAVAERLAVRIAEALNGA